MKQWYKDFIHNCIIHPLLPFLPLKMANKLHYDKSTWAFGLQRFDELQLENKK